MDKLREYLPSKEIFSNMQMFLIFVFGVISGIPIAIFYTLLPAWMVDQNLSLSAIGVFALARSPYAFKYIWAPVVEHYKIPFFFNYLGRRRSWMMLASLLTPLLLLVIINIDLHQHLNIVFALSLLLGFSAATFDIAYEAFRIELLDDELQPLGVASSVFGFRIGMLVTGAGALYISAQSSWEISFAATAFFILFGAFCILIANEPESRIRDIKKLDSNGLHIAIVKPILQFLKYNKSLLIILTIITYRVGEAMLGTMLIPFFMETGFSKNEIAIIVNIFGLIATLAGAYLGGILMMKYNHVQVLFLCSIPQMLSNLSFVWLNHVGADVTALTISIAFENFTAGMGTTALVGYLCILCDKRYTATQYAILSALAAMANNTIPFISGSTVEYYGWDLFFIFTAVISLPGVIFSYVLTKAK